jgi:imidazoleglycerol-phosphate dehydratase
MGERKIRAIRDTLETDIKIDLDLDGTGDARVATGVPFFDHMLKSFAKHGHFDLVAEADGDIDVDPHHTVEDVGITLGQALAQALGDKRGIARFGDAMVPMDDALARVALDLSGRPFLSYNVTGLAVRVANFDTDLAGEFFRALATNAGITMHVDLLRGDNAHHSLEAIFKALGQALFKATRITGVDVPSTKGVLA